MAITRARRELIVFASFLPEQIGSERSKARGVHDLKAFLEYAEKGPEAIIPRTDGSLGDPESPLEEAVAGALGKLGWQLDTQVGVSGYRIDLGILHPDKPNVYLAGVECDGATYHRSAVARDRDKTRQQVLEHLGWTITRVWSTDWWYDPDSAAKQLDEFLNERLTQAREDEVKKASEISSREDTDNVQAEVADTAEQDRGNEEDLECETSTYKASPLDDASEEKMARPQLVARQAQPKERRLYVRAELPDATAHQDRFFDEDCSDALQAMAAVVLDVQGPIRDDALAREIARAHGFARTGSKIRQRILDLLPSVTATMESTGRFLWADESPQESFPFRYPADDSERRIHRRTGCDKREGCLPHGPNESQSGETSHPAPPCRVSHLRAPLWCIYPLDSGESTLYAAGIFGETGPASWENR